MLHVLQTYSFVTPEGKPLSRTFFVKKRKDVIFKLGLNPSNFNGYSFWIDAATSAAKGSFSSHTWQTSLSAYTQYVRTADESIKQVQVTVCKTYSSGNSMGKSISCEDITDSIFQTCYLKHLGGGGGGISAVYSSFNKDIFCIQLQF